MVRIHQPKPRQAKLKIENSKLKICWRILIYALILNSQLSILNSCASPSHKQFNPAKVDFSVAVNPFLDNQLYPSLILALDQSKPSILNTDLSTLTCTVTSPANNAVLRIVVDSSVFNYVSILQEIMPHRGETYTFAPVIKWKYDRLRNLRNPVPLDLTLTCYINDEEVDTKTIHLTARSVNECPLSLSHKGAILDTRWLFAAYVNEDHPDIEQILTDILSQGNITRLTGYQTGKTAAVDDQVFAVWYYALDHGISYSSITCTSNPPPPPTSSTSASSTRSTSHARPTASTRASSSPPYSARLASVPSSSSSPATPTSATTPTAAKPTSTSSKPPSPPGSTSRASRRHSTPTAGCRRKNSRRYPNISARNR